MDSLVQLIPAILVVVDHHVVVRVVAVLAALLPSAALLSATTGVFPTRFGLSRRGSVFGGKLPWTWVEYCYNVSCWVLARGYFGWNQHCAGMNEEQDHTGLLQQICLGFIKDSSSSRTWLERRISSRPARYTWREEDDKRKRKRKRCQINSTPAQPSLNSYPLRSSVDRYQDETERFQHLKVPPFSAPRSLASSAAVVGEGGGGSAQAAAVGLAPLAGARAVVDVLELVDARLASVEGLGAAALLQAGLGLANLLGPELEGCFFLMGLVSFCSLGGEGGRRGCFPAPGGAIARKGDILLPLLSKWKPQ